MPLPRSKLPPRTEQISDRQHLAVQAALRQVAADSNARMRCVAIDEYTDSPVIAWATALSTTTSSTFVDSAQQLTLSQPVLVGDILHIVGRLNSSIDAGSVGDYQLAIYEGSLAQVTAKDSAFWENGAGFQSSAITCKHRITKAGVAKVAVQFMRKSGAGNVYVESKGSLVVQTWRP